MEEVVPKQLRKLNRSSFDENCTHLIQKKKWKTRHRLSETLNTVQKIPAELPLNKKIAIVSPIFRNGVVKDKTVPVCQALPVNGQRSRIIHHPSQIRQPPPAIDQQASSPLTPNQSPSLHQTSLISNHSSPATNQSSHAPDQPLLAFKQPVHQASPVNGQRCRIIRHPSQICQPPAATDQQASLPTANQSLSLGQTSLTSNHTSPAASQSTLAPEKPLPALNKPAPIHRASFVNGQRSRIIRHPSQIHQQSQVLCQLSPAAGQSLAPPDQPLLSLNQPTPVFHRTSPALNQKTPVRQASPALSRLPGFSKAKPIVLKRNCTSVIGKTHCQSFSLKTSTPKLTLINQRMVKNSRKLGDSHLSEKNLKQSLNLPKVSPVSDQKRKAIYIGTSPLLNTLECKQKRQQKFKIDESTKNPKYTGGSTKQGVLRLRVSESSNIPPSTQSISKIKQSTKMSSNVITMDVSFTHQPTFQKTIFSPETKPDSTKRTQSDKTSAFSSKILHLPLKKSERIISTLSVKNKTCFDIHTHRSNSSIIPNIKRLTSRHRFKKMEKSSSKASVVYPDQQLSRRNLLDGESGMKNSAHLDVKHQRRNSTSLVVPNNNSLNESTNLSLVVEKAKLNDSKNLNGSIVKELIWMSQRDNKDIGNLNNISTKIGSLTSLDSSMEIDELSRSQCFVIVLDTNILMHKQKFIDVLKDTPLEGCGPPYLYIPWIILFELDGLKSNSKNKNEAVQAMKYLHTMFSAKHPRFLGQKYRMSAEDMKAYGDTNDDKLLSACMVLAQKIPKDKLVLLSNDICLSTKALMCDINAYTTENLFTKIKPDVRILHEKDCPKNLPDTKMTIENLIKPITKQLEVDNIVCEAKLILKEILEPFLSESMEHAFGDMRKTFLSPPPETLLDILGYYEKYWVSVFGTLFNKDVKKYFDQLKELFSPKQGLLSDVDDAFAALIAVENICKAVAMEKPSINKQICKISQLTDACKSLSRLGDEPMDDKKKSEITFEFFNHLWSLMDYLCGMIMDFTGLPHTLKYDKPTVMPPMSEFQRVISNFFPSLQKIKLGMSKVIDITTASEQAEHEDDYKCLYDSLLQFVPSLQIKAAPPPTEKFSIQCLKHFMLDQDYRKKIEIGFRQLKDHQTKLVKAIHLQIWK